MTLAERYGALHILRPGWPSIPDGLIDVADRSTLTGTYRWVPVVSPPRPSRPFRNRRDESFYIQVLNEFGSHVTYCRAELGGRIDATTGAQITRTLSNLVLKPGTWEELDLAAMRLRPVMVIDGVPYSLGVFVVVDDVEHATSRGTYLELQCADQGDLLQATFDQTWNLIRGASIGTGIASILDTANIYDRAVVASSPRSSAFLGRPIGATYWDALDKLTKLAGLTAPWFDRNGTCRVIQLPYIGATPRTQPDWEAGDMSPILEGSMRRVRGRWRVPNSWLVIGRSDDGVRYAGRYTLPASHPLSVQNRHRTITETSEVAGIASQDDADARARDAGQLDPKVHETRELSVRADPTLEPWQIRRTGGEDWLVASWSHTLEVGQDQQLKVRESVMA